MQLKISTVGLGAMIPPILVHQPQFYVIENYVHLIYFAYLIFVISFTLAGFLKTKFYTQKND